MAPHLNDYRLTAEQSLRPSYSAEHLVPPPRAHSHEPAYGHDAEARMMTAAEAEHMRRQQRHMMSEAQERARMRDNAYRAEQLAREEAARAPSPSRPSSRKQPQHKVYLVNCKHCDLFLTDRGMKAILLLKPNITLFSTDALPNNCSPIHAPSAFFGGFDETQAPVERTCDCLTQTLGCHGCGAAVGYNIVAPCARCTSSVAKHQRGSNG